MCSSVSGATSDLHLLRVREWEDAYADVYISSRAGISQRDLNFYDHLQPADTRREIVDRVRAFWEDEIRGKYQGGKDCKWSAIRDWPVIGAGTMRT